MGFLSNYFGVFLDQHGEGPENAEVRRKMLDKLLYIFSLVGLPAIILGAVRSYTQGRWGSSIIYIVSYLLFVLAALASRKFPFRLRALIPVSSLFVVALTSLATVGMSGSGIQLMLGVCFLAALLFGLRGGMLALLVTLVCIGVLAIGMTTGFIDISPERMMTSRSPVPWLTAICVFFMIVSITVIGFQMFSRRIEESLDLIGDHKRELEAANEHLREASVIISKSRAVAFLWSNREGWPVEYVSDNVENVFGYTAQEFLTGQIVYSSAIHPEDLPRLDGEVSRYSRDHGREGFTHGPYRIVTKQGEVRWVEDTTHARRDSRGEITHYQGIVQDITERKRAEEEKEKLQDQLQRAQKMEAIGTLAGGVAHDLNNILSGIVSYPDLLLMQLPKDSPLEKPLATIRESGKRAAAIVQDLLTLARRTVPTSEVVNLNDVISEYLQSPEHDKLKTFHPHVQVETNLDTDLLNILGSPVHVSKALMNLISNAVEAMPDGGKVLVSTGNRYIDSPVTGYDHVEEGDYVTLSISDTGVGISSEDREKIFEPFYTGKVMGRSGTGLGMAVVWGTVKDHKGYIDVQSSEGKGAVFMLYFPVTRKELVKERPSFSIEEYKGDGESILVVDDVEGQREIASALLSHLGYSVTTVSGGEEAVEYMKTTAVDLVVLDMIMDPGIDGLETYKKILGKHPNQKAVIASGFSETARVKEAQRLGAGEYIKKPYTLEKIGMAVRKELDR